MREGGIDLIMRINSMLSDVNSLTPRWSVAKAGGADWFGGCLLLLHIFGDSRSSGSSGSSSASGPATEAAGCRPRESVFGLAELSGGGRFGCRGQVLRAEPESVATLNETKTIRIGVI